MAAVGADDADAPPSRDGDGAALVEGQADPVDNVDSVGLGDAVARGVADIDASTLGLVEAVASSELDAAALKLAATVGVVLAIAVDDGRSGVAVTNDEALGERLGAPVGVARTDTDTLPLELPPPPLPPLAVGKADVEGATDALEGGLALASAVSESMRLALGAPLELAAADADGAPLGVGGASD